MVFVLKICLIICLIVITKLLISKQIGRAIRNELCLLEKEDKYINIPKNKYILKSIYSSIIIFISILAGNTLLKSLFYGIITCFLLINYEIIRGKTKKKEILQDLLNVSECLRVQISSNISLSIALRNIPELCKNKEFSLELTNLYLEYELSKFTIANSSSDLISKFNYPEIKMFISAINQQSLHTSALEAFDNLIEVLKEKYIDYMEENTRTKSLIMVFAVCIVVFNIAAMSVYPIIIEAGEAIQVMFL